MEMLSEVGTGKSAIVTSNEAGELLKERLMSLGLTNGAVVEVLRKGPKNNLTVYRIRGAMIALRKEESSLIKVSLAK
ncbi:ferrous iron transport protein A [Clostridium bornimense]|uniref:FeoA family protein n=1 Tax=Clostridium bornimense TaxID=1216932 RepID=UPI001C10EEC8|nr:FeoA family protein [Clostridium bornimense]MBU5316727.1 ferrous iron transport protein A [Clostridium bornimense]